MKGAVRSLIRALGRVPLRVVGAVSAVALFLNLNLLSARYNCRWDWTEDERYTLSAPTQVALSALREPLTAWLLLPREDPRRERIEGMLRQYEAAAGSSFLVRVIQPLQQEALFRRLTAQYGLGDPSELAQSAAVVLTHKGRHWVLREGDPRVTIAANGWRLEEALTEGVQALVSGRQVSVCLASGTPKTEAGRLDEHTLPRFAAALRRSNFVLESRALDQEGALHGCGLVVVAPAHAPVSAPAIAVLRRHAATGGRLLVVAGVVFDDQQSVASSPLEPLLADYGLRALPRLVLERDPARTPAASNFGEIFLAEVKAHPITRELGTSELLVRLAQPLERSEFRSGHSGRALLATSVRARAVPGLASAAGEVPGPFTVAWAVESSVASSSRSGRLVVLGSDHWLSDGLWVDAARTSERGFVEAALAWLADRAVVSQVPARGSRPATLRLTDASMARVARYAIFYLPGAALLLGVLVTLRRRRAAGSEPRGLGR